jgi:DHA1 family multidrug resistance protein-like MFS transporter
MFSHQAVAAPSVEQTEAPKLNWRRNLYICVVALAVATIGFDAAVPFLAAFVQELGVTDANQVKLWTGLLFSANSVSLAIMGPVWGALGDRLGYKPMVQRAMFAGSIFIGIMGFVSTPSQLLALRILQGAMTGFSTTTFTLVSAATPVEHCGYALGLLQMVAYLGAALGPVLGGIAADTWGYRACFLITGALMGLGALLVTFLVREPQRKLASKDSRSLRQGLSVVLGSSAILVVLAVRSLVESGQRTVNPFLPLFVQELVTVQARVATQVGLLNGAKLAATAVGAIMVGRFADRLGARRVALLALMSAAGGYLLQGAAISVAQLLVLQVVTGAAIGGMITTLSVAAATLCPAGRQGVVFGLQITFVQAANAVGPMFGALVATQWGLRGVFVLAGLACLAALLLLIRIKWTPARA